jgi:DNA-binding transcriptional MerR regulator
VITFTELAEELGVKVDTLAYHVKRKRIPQWTMLGWQRVYTQDQAEEARRYWQSHVRYQHAGKD